MPVFLLLQPLLGRDVARTHPLAAGLALGALAFAVTLPIAHLSERRIERPGIVLGRRLTASTPSARTAVA